MDLASSLTADLLTMLSWFSCLYALSPPPKNKYSSTDRTYLTENANEAGVRELPVVLNTESLIKAYSQASSTASSLGTLPAESPDPHDFLIAY